VTELLGFEVTKKSAQLARNELRGARISRLRTQSRGDYTLAELIEPTQVAPWAALGCTWNWLLARLLFARLLPDF